MSDPTTIVTVHVATVTHGRCLVRPAAGPPAGWLVGFHGYGQNAAALLADLDAIPGAHRWTAVSVQALHRFYTRSGEVVASWMTREDRELAIADNVEYVRRVVAQVRVAGAPGEEPSKHRLPLVFVGFSQGVATAFRAAIHIDECSGVIALGGDVPPDVRVSGRPLPPVLLGRGNDDEWYGRDKFDADVAWLRSTNPATTICAFDGGHAWTDDFRTVAGRLLESVLLRSG